MRKNSIKHNILISILTFLIIFIIIEFVSYLLLNFILQDKIINQSSIAGCNDNYKEWDAYLIMSVKKNFTSGDFCKINSQGFLGNEFLVDKTNNVYRIFVLGGSTVWGLGSSSLNKTIPYLIEQKLNKNNNLNNFKFEVINAGVEGYASTQELIRFIRDIYRYDPDMVIAFNGRNDMFYSHKKFWSYKINHETILRIKPLVDFNPSFTMFFEMIKLGVNKLFSKTNLYALINRWRPENIIYEKEGVFNPDSAEEYWNNMDVLVKIAKSRNVIPVIFLQPTLGYGKKDLSEHELNKINIINERSNWIEILHNLIPLYEQKIKKISEENDVLALSLTQIFNNVSENIYVDSVHYNDLGNEIIVDKIVELLEERYDFSKSKK